MINEEVMKMGYIPDEPEQGAFLRQEEEVDDTLGPCGCVDYHMADCPTRTGYADSFDQDDWYDSWA